MSDEMQCLIDAELGESRLDPMDTEMAAINRLSLKPLARDDVAIFSMDLCNNQVDRHCTRFAPRALREITGMIVGKPVMENHDLPNMFNRGSQPRGTFFQSRLHADASKTSVRADFYMLRTEENADFIKNIEGGVYRGTSIGFIPGEIGCSVCESDLRQCAHMPGEDYNGHRCHGVIHDVQDVLEGSLVPIGSQSTEIVEARAMPENGAFYLEQAIPHFRAAKKDVDTTNSKAYILNELDEQLAEAAVINKRLRERNL